VDAGKYGLALFSSVTFANKTKNNRHKDENKKRNSNYKTTKHSNKLTEETRQRADIHSTVQSERQHNEVGL